LKGKDLKTEISNYKWNYVYDVEKGESKVYPCNPTRHEILKRLEKVENFDSREVYTDEFEEALWHIIYSVTDKFEFEKALKSFAKKNGLDVESFVEIIIRKLLHIKVIMELTHLKQ
jgi:CRISPR-associated endonuclease Csn1